jgi:hypothetical protein
MEYSIYESEKFSLPIAKIDLELTDEQVEQLKKSASPEAILTTGGAVKGKAFASVEALGAYVRDNWLTQLQNEFKEKVAGKLQTISLEFSVTFGIEAKAGIPVIAIGGAKAEGSVKVCLQFEVGG